MNPALAAYIKQTPPESMLECSTTPWQQLEPLCREQHTDFYLATPQDILNNSLTSGQTVDLAIVHDALETITPAAGQQLLGCLRNSLASRIWLSINEGSGWPIQALLALGFKRDHNSPLAASGVKTYSYDLSSYNRKRSWNNPRFWANPENFHKYRW